ncbi:EmrB/QacA subfamily drug resistance transporter [Williamsia limnetica]|uniref:EmrB/QacA subfamily drug resistance transporter n=2 Tax=Williamsia limnetica TaxID=882452 RepID=A0A318RHG0_WILLI|nr:EmrB/QacA subfamily drug resistance transporter [Williamsia limnetica]
MQMVDTTIVNIALPSLATDLDATYSAQLLVATVYTLAFACTLMTGSRLGERFGRRRVFLGALTGFTVASVLCGTASGAGELIALRGVQGVCAAAASAQTIAIISVLFPRAKHGAVFGIYGATAGVAAMLGPMLGGVLIAVDVFGWGWRTIFLVNLPLGAAACLIAYRHLPAVRSVAHEQFDVIGMVLSSTGLFMLIYPLAVGREKNWPASLLLMLAVAVLLLAIFVFYERRLQARGGSPLLRLDLFSHRSFSVGAVLSVTFFSVFAAFFFTVSIAAQFGLGYSPLRTGVLTFPFAVGAAVGSVVSPWLVARIGSRTLTVGMSAFAVCLGWLAVVIDPAGESLELLTVLLPLLIGGVGTGLFVAPLQATILSGTTSSNVGSASGTIPTIQQIGCSVGLALISIAFFNQVAAQSQSAVGDAGITLSRSLESTTVAAALRPVVVDEFTRCAHVQLSSPHPELTPPGCAADASSAAPTPGDIRSTVAAAAASELSEAARQAAARSFLGALTMVLWAIAGAAVLLACITLLLKRPVTAAAEADR